MTLGIRGSRPGLAGRKERKGAWPLGPEVREGGFSIFQILFYFVFKTKFNYEPNQIQIEF